MTLTLIITMLVPSLALAGPALAVAPRASHQPAHAVTFALPASTGSLYLNPNPAYAGARVHATGGGYFVQEIVALFMDSTTLLIVTGSRNGHINITFTLPSTVTVGTHLIVAKGALSGRLDTAQLVINPTITWSLPSPLSAGNR